MVFRQRLKTFMQGVNLRAVPSPTENVDAAALIDVGLISGAHPRTGGSTTHRANDSIDLPFV
jgi:hypothetical protein